MRIVRTGLGALYLFAPDWIPSVLSVRVDRRARVVVRLLGARNLAQAVMVSIAPSQPVAPAIGAAVDLVHASSMVVLAAADQRCRRLALADAGAATVFAATGWRRACRISESGAR